jgi:uncharacterized protein YkwD
MKKYLYFLFSVLLAFNACKKEDTNVQLQEVSSIDTEILKLVNQHRNSIGKADLVMDSTIWRFAKEHTQYQIEQGLISHDNFSDRMNELGALIAWSGAAENVAMGYTDAQSVVTGWLNSAGHKANIEGDYSLTGVCALKDNNGVYYYTQIFINK